MADGMRGLAYITAVIPRGLAADAVQQRPALHSCDEEGAIIICQRKKTCILIIPLLLHPDARLKSIVTPDNYSVCYGPAV